MDGTIHIHVYRGACVHTRGQHMSKQYANSTDTKYLALRAWGERVSMRLHVWASNREVIRACWRSFSPISKRREHRLTRRFVYQGALHSHWEHQSLVRKWRL